MSNIINFPANDLMASIDELSDAENHVIKFCFSDDEINTERLESLLDAAVYVMAVHCEQEDSVGYLRELINRLKHIYSPGSEV